MIHEEKNKETDSSDERKKEDMGRHAGREQGDSTVSCSLQRF